MSSHQTVPGSKLKRWISPAKEASSEANETSLAATTPSRVRLALRSAVAEARRVGWLAGQRGGQRGGRRRVEEEGREEGGGGWRRRAERRAEEGRRGHGLCDDEREHTCPVDGDLNVEPLQLCVRSAMPRPR